MLIGTHLCQLARSKSPPFALQLQPGPQPDTLRRQRLSHVVRRVHHELQKRRWRSLDRWMLACVRRRGSERGSASQQGASRQQGWRDAPGRTRHSGTSSSMSLNRFRSITVGSTSFLPPLPLVAPVACVGPGPPAPPSFPPIVSPSRPLPLSDTC